MSDLAEATKLLDRLKLRGWQFAQTEHGDPDSPLQGIKRRSDGSDVVYIDGCERNCACWRTPDNYVMGSDPPSNATDVYRGDAVSVLTMALSWESEEGTPRLIIPKL